MATAVKSQIVPLPGCSQTKPPVPPKPLPGEEKKSVKKKSDHNVSSESPLGLVSETSEDKGPEAKPSTSQTTDSAKKPAPGVKRSQSTDAKPKPKYVLKPLRQHHSFQEKMKKPHVDKRTTRVDTTSSKIRDWFCLPLASFVVKTKDGGTSLIEKGKGRLFGKGPGPPKKLKRPAPNPPRGEENLSIPSRPKVPPRPVLQRILADIDNGKGAGKWHKLENVKYVDEEVTTEDSTDYSDVDWGQAIHSAPGEESIIYFTYIEEGPNERVIFYQSVRRDEVVSSSEDDDADDNNKRTTTSRHVAEMEDMEIDDYEPIELANEVALLTSVQMNGKPEVEDNSKDFQDFQDLNDSKDEEQSVDKPIPPIEVEVTEVTRSHSPEMHKNLSIIVEEEEAVKSSPPPRPPSPKYPPPAKSSSPIFPLLSRSPSPILRMLSRTPSPKPDTPREQSPVIIYEKFETKVKVVEKNIPITDARLPLIEREIPAVTTHLPTENDEKNEPAYARVQKYSPPKSEITEISEDKINENPIENVNEPIITKSEPYYDLDVADSAPKVKPKRPPRPAPPPPPPPPKVVPPPPPKIAPPPVPPKTYMMVQFPPPLMKKEIEELEKFENIDETQLESEPVFEVMEAVSKVELGVEMNGNLPEKDEIEIEKEITEQVEIDVKLEKDISEEIKDENIVADSFKQEEEANNNNNNTDNNNFHLKSHLSLGESEVSDDKLRSTSALVLNETSESGFMSSPTPPPRHRRKRFRSMEGPTRGSIEDVGIPIPLRRSKSISGSENRESWPNSEKSATPSVSKEKLDAPKPPQPPQRPNIRPKPARPPKPKITVVKQLAQQPSMVCSEPDLHSLISSNGGSPPLIVMKARPLPPPPTPPRHRFPMKSSDRESNVASKTPPIPISSNFPYEFLAKLSEIEAGKLSLNEINVKRINVQEIEADVIRAGSLQVGVISQLVSVSKDDKDGDGDKKGEENKKDEIMGNKEKCQDGGGGENDQVCPKENEKDVQESDKGIEDTDQKLCQEVIEEMVKDTLLRDLTDDVKAEKEGDKEDKFMKGEQVTDPFTEPPVAFPSELGSSTFYLSEDQPDKSRSPTPSSTNGGKSSKKNRERKTSWYDEGVVPGQSGDVDTSDGRAEGSTDSPTLIKQLETTPEPHKSLISLANRSSDRKKASKVGRGSLQLYPREESPSSSSTTDAEVDEQKTRHHRGSRSRSLSAGYSMERQMPQLDPNANYCVDQVANANLNKQCPGNGQCDSPPQSRKELATMMEDVEASPKLDRFSNVQDATKRLSLLSIPTSEDSWYNCTSGDESESESSFSTAASCQDNSSSASVVTDVRRTKKYFIARELMSSERVFVDALKLLNEDFRNVVKEANAKTDQKVIPVAVLDQILNYLPQLHNLNLDLLKDLQERIKNWEQMDRIADVITKKGPFLKLYSAYIKDFEMITSSLDEACKKYPLFAQVVKDFEMSDRCNKLALKHFMLKPVQRIPQYKLILHEYLKHVNSDSPEHEETVAALKIVTDVANHANQAMKQGDNFAKLLHIQNSIIGGGYEVIRPGRLFLREGELSKLSRKVMQPRWFILFNDALLHTDVNQGSLRLHHELPLSAMRVVVPTNEEHLNEFSVISSTRSFTLSANSLQERDEWVSALNNAIKANAQRRGTFALAVDKTISPHDDVEFTLGKNAPVWIPDVRVTMCQCCITPFTVTFRRHHCRACGKVVCATCSANRAPLQYLKFQSARVCDECFFRLAEAFDNTPSESDCSTERASQSESGDVNTSDIQRANIKAQFKRYATSGGKKMERRLPRVLKEVGANHQGAAISGYLNKKTKKGWRRYWFVINDKVLYTYKASEDVAALESIPLLGFKLESNFEVFEGGDSNLGFQLIHPNHHSLIFCGENEDATEKWKKEMHLATLLE